MQNNSYNKKQNMFRHLLQKSFNMYKYSTVNYCSEATLEDKINKLNSVSTLFDNC